MATKLSTSSGAGLAAGTGGANLLPRSVSTDIWKKATALSIIPTLATSKPMILGENTFPVLTKRPAASIVGEGANKPDSDIEIGSKTVKPIKAVVGLEFTMEAILTNPGGVLDLMSEEMAGALARQIDLAVLHKTVAASGGAISGVEAVADTTNAVALDTVPTAANGGIDKLLWDGYGLVVNTNDANFTGFAFDPRLVYTLGTARDVNGRRLHPELTMVNQGLSNFEGQPAAISKTVSADVDASDDTGIRAFGGDWDALKFGYVLDIGVRKIEYGDPFGNGDLQRRNAVAYLAEVIFGWAIMDLNAFVKYTVDLTP
jgi:HK97 family phage major capsid protein